MSTNVQHTPGQRTVAGGEFYTPIMGENGERIATLLYRADQPTRGEAFVRLTVAAPALLAACESALPFMQESWKRQGIGGMFEVMDAMRSAVAQARGK